MVLGTLAHHAHSNYTDQDADRPIIIVNKTTPLTYIIYVIDLCILAAAFYYYFKCNFAEGVISSNTDKVLGFLGACCCHVLYIVYHVVVPC